MSSINRGDDNSIEHEENYSAQQLIDKSQQQQGIGSSTASQQSSISASTKVGSTVVSVLYFLFTTLVALLLITFTIVFFDGIVRFRFEVALIAFDSFAVFVVLYSLVLSFFQLRYFERTVGKYFFQQLLGTGYVYFVCALFVLPIWGTHSIIYAMFPHVQRAAVMAMSIVLASFILCLEVFVCVMPSCFPSKKLLKFKSLRNEDDDYYDSAEDDDEHHDDAGGNDDEQKHRKTQDTVILPTKKPANRPEDSRAVTSVDNNNATLANNETTGSNVMTTLVQEEWLVDERTSNAYKRINVDEH